MVSALSALMQEKFNILKGYKIIEYKKYPWYDPATKKIIVWDDGPIPMLKPSQHLMEQ